MTAVGSPIRPEFQKVRPHTRPNLFFSRPSPSPTQNHQTARRSASWPRTEDAAGNPTARSRAPPRPKDPRRRTTPHRLVAGYVSRPTLCTTRLLQDLACPTFTDDFAAQRIPGHFDRSPPLGRAASRRFALSNSASATLSLGMICSAPCRFLAMILALS